MPANYAQVFQKKIGTCMNCVWREKEVESKCSNMLTFSDNLDK